MTEDQTADVKKKNTDIFDSQWLVLVTVAVLLVCCCSLTLLIVVTCKHMHRLNKALNPPLPLHAVSSISTLDSPSTTNTRGTLTTGGGSAFNRKHKESEPGEIKLVSWLEEVGLLQYYDLFVENGFGDGEQLEIALSEMTNEDLKDMGVSKVAHRKLILKQIKQDTQSKRQQVQMVAMSSPYATVEPVVVEIGHIGSDVEGPANTRNVGGYVDADEEDAAESSDDSVLFANTKGHRTPIGLNTTATGPCGSV